MNYSISEILVISVVGLGIVFAVLVILMVLISAFGAAVGAVDKKSGRNKDAETIRTARGSCGEVSIFDVPDKTAAMVMAIVADRMGAPLNELRFLSIKEVKNDEV